MLNLPCIVFRLTEETGPRHLPTRREIVPYGSPEVSEADGEVVGNRGEIVAGMIRRYSKTPGLRSVLRCRRHNRCRGPRAHASPWQKPLLQRSECAGTGRHL